MDINELQSRLMAAARKNPPGEQVPYAFEKRIMAHLASLAQPDPWNLWARALWRAAASCVAITLLLGVWSFASLQHAESPETLFQAFEHSVFAGMPHHIEDSW
jgi:hypothetical protein